MAEKVSSLFSNLDWGNWFYGLISGIIGGGASAVTSGISVSMIDPKDWSIGSAKFFTLCGIVFLANGMLSAFFFLKQTPLPPLARVTVTSVGRASDPNPMVTTKVETMAEIPKSPDLPLPKE